MKIDLHNFFKNYDKENLKHIAAVEQLEVDLNLKDSSLLDDTANWIRIYRSHQETSKQTVVLKVPYYSQTDNYSQPDSTCNSSSCAMCLEFLKPGTLKGEKGDDAYLKKVLALGQSTDHSVQTKVLKSYEVNSNFSYNLDFSDLDVELAARRPVVLGILHRGTLDSPRGGHMIVCIGKSTDGKSYIFNDPYGNLMDGYSSPVENGKGAVYPKSVLEKRWTIDGPKNGWGRRFQ